MHLFGLTGGIASGKSVVASRFRARALPVIDADLLARDVVAPGSEGLSAVAAAFGAGVVGEDGSLDRKRVAALVFNDETRRRQLNGLLHPRIAALLLERAAALRAAGEPLACYEATLIVENGMQDAFRPLVVVAAPEDLQVARARARDAATVAEVLARIRAQMPLGEKIKVADHVIHNTGTLAELNAEADRTLDAICEARAVAPARYPVPA